MRTLLMIGGAVGLAGWMKRRTAARNSVDLTAPHVDRPQEPIEQMEREADIPGGVRP